MEYTMKRGEKVKKQENVKEGIQVAITAAALKLLYEIGGEITLGDILKMMEEELKDMNTSHGNENSIREIQKLTNKNDLDELFGFISEEG
jgi:CRISPR/Cas system CSM-associated protein Csm2 small subunit